MTHYVKIPCRFYDDHCDRELPAPPVIKVCSRYYVIDADHPDHDELCNDCDYYADVNGPGETGIEWYKTAARALKRSLQTQKAWKP